DLLGIGQWLAEVPSKFSSAKTLEPSTRKLVKHPRPIWSRRVNGGGFVSRVVGRVRCRLRHARNLGVLLARAKPENESRLNFIKDTSDINHLLLTGTRC